MIPNNGSRFYKIKVSGFLVLGSFLNFFFPFLIAKSLTVQSFGIFAVLWAEITIFSYVLSGVQTHVAVVTTKAIVQGELKPKDYVFDPFTARFLRILALPVLLILLVGLVSGANGTVRNLCYFAAVAIPTTSLTAITLGKLQGNNEPLYFFRTVFFITLAKILWVPIFFSFSDSPLYFIFSLMLIQLSLILLASWSNPVRNALQFDQLDGFLVKIVSLSLVFWSFLNSDTLLARGQLSLEMSGLYSAASSLSKVPIALTAILLIIYLPRVTELDAQEKSSSRLRRYIYTFVIFQHVVFYLLSNYFGTFMIQILLGEKYSGSYQMFVWLSLISGAFSILLVYFTLNVNKLARKNVYISLFVLFGNIVILGTINMEIQIFIVLFGLFAFIMLVLNVLLIRFSKKQRIT
jgi:O-antigen/teichoic acid export membrane protein